MPRKTARERIEDIVRQPADFPFDGHITEIRPGHVTMRMLGSNKIKRNIALPDHIPYETLTLGMPGRILYHQNQPVLVEVFKNFNELPDYSGKGSIIPNPPRPSVVAGPSGWEITWPAVSGASKYQVFRNDAPNPNSPDNLGYTTTLKMIVPYEGAYRWFAVRAISGLQESELSAWVTDLTPPATPNTFMADDALNGHRLTIQGTDISLSHYGFKYWEAESADSALGENNTSLGYFGPVDFPKVVEKLAGETNWYRIRALDYADNPSEWSAWDSATALTTSVPTGSEIEDRFDGYGGTGYSDLESLYWLQAANGSEPIANEGGIVWGEGYFWLSGAVVSRLTGASAIYGDGSLKAGMPLPSRPDDSGPSIGFFRQEALIPLDVESRFGDSDFLTFYIYCSPAFIANSQDIPNPANDNILTVEILSATSAAHTALDLGVDLVAGVNKVAIKKSDFTIEAGFDWGEAYYISLYTGYEIQTYNVNVYMIVDDIRFAKADPNNPATWNDTGGVWNFTGSNELEAGIWHVYPGMVTGEPRKPYSLGQIDTTGSGKHLLAYRQADIDTGMVQVGVYFKDAQADGGLCFFMSNHAPGLWTFYAVRASAAANMIYLEKWQSGTMTVLGSAQMTIDANQTIWLGVDLREFASDAGRLKVYATKVEGNIVQAANLVISTQNSDLSAGGSVGLVCRDRNTRFVSFLAGSPAHAVVADVAMALDGPIIAGGTKRVRFNPETDWFEISTDGVNWSSLVPPA